MYWSFISLFMCHLIQLILIKLFKDGNPAVIEDSPYVHFHFTFLSGQRLTDKSYCRLETLKMHRE